MKRPEIGTSNDDQDRMKLMTNMYGANGFKKFIIILGYTSEI